MKTLLRPWFVSLACLLAACGSTSTPEHVLTAQEDCPSCGVTGGAALAYTDPVLGWASGPQAWTYGAERESTKGPEVFLSPTPAGSLPAATLSVGCLRQQWVFSWPGLAGVRREFRSTPALALPQPFTREAADEACTVAFGPGWQVVGGSGNDLGFWATGRRPAVTVALW